MLQFKWVVSLVFEPLTYIIYKPTYHFEFAWW